jgi:hypothetical protein
MEASEAECVARMEAIEAKWRARRRKMDADLQERLANIEATWKKRHEEWTKALMGTSRKSTEACEEKMMALLETTEACPVKTRAYLEKKEGTKEQQQPLDGRLGHIEEGGGNTKPAANVAPTLSSTGIQEEVIQNGSEQIVDGGIETAAQMPEAEKPQEVPE